MRKPAGALRRGEINVRPGAVSGYKARQEARRQNMVSFAFHRTLQDIGVKIHKLKHIKLHAKLLLADDKVAIVGSINLAPGSFDSRRELAIRVDDEHITRRILKTLEEDWANSHPMDLSDEGLVAELKKHDPNVREDLGIGESKHKKDK